MRPEFKVLIPAAQEICFVIRYTPHFTMSRHGDEVEACFEWRKDNRCLTIFARAQTRTMAHISRDGNFLKHLDQEIEILQISDPTLRDLKTKTIQFPNTELQHHLLTAWHWLQDGEQYEHTT